MKQWQRSICYISLMALIYPNSVLASSLPYFKEKTELENAEAEKQHKILQQQSKKLRFLDCPIEMIERQWGGLASVNEGVNILETYLKEMHKPNPDYLSINETCQQKLAGFRKNSADEKMAPRKIAACEISQFNATGTNIVNEIGQIVEVDANRRNLVRLVASAINQETLCYEQRTAATLGYGLTVSGGVSRLICYTPLGRRFSLRGPAFGVGVGVIAGLTIPSPGRLSTPTYKMFLYQQPEKNSYNFKKIVSVAAFGPGITLSHDCRRAVKKERDGQKYVFVYGGDIGVGVNTEYVINTMRKKSLKPLYYPMNKYIDIGSMAETVN